MYTPDREAGIRPELLEKWGSGQVAIPAGFWGVARPREVLRVGQVAREHGQLEIIDAVAQCAFTQTLATTDDAERTAFAAVFAAVELGHPGNAGLQA